jgi:hypothetical protein
MPDVVHELLAPEAAIVSMTYLAAIDLTGALVSSAVVAAIVGGLSSFITQRYLLDRKARVDYEFMARKRLNEAIGPLRMQLLFSARDVVGRVQSHADTRWNMDPAAHFARSFIYRLLRPLALAQLIERQMSVADFSVDPDAIALLRFNRSAERMLSGDDVVSGHPDADWSTQSQHLFRDNLRVAAARLIVEGDDMPTVLDYSRFQQEVPDPESDVSLRDLALIFRRCNANLTENPLFWLRVVAYAYTCHRLIADQGLSVGFENIPLDAEEMLRAVDDELMASQAAARVAVFDRILSKGL